MIEHHEAVAPVAVRALADEFVARAHREVHQRVVEVDIERLVILDRLFHELDRALLVFQIAGLLRLHGELLGLDRLAAAVLRALVHVRETVALRHVMRILEPHAFVIGAQRTVPFVEPVVGREASVLGADVPFALDAGLVARFGQNVGDRAFPAHDAAGIAAERDRVIAGPDRIAARHESRTCRRALRLDDIMRELHAFLGECIHPLRIRAAENAAAVAAGLAHAEIVDMKEQDIGFFRRHL